MLFQTNPNKLVWNTFSIKKVEKILLEQNEGWKELKESAQKGKEDRKNESKSES